MTPPSSAADRPGQPGPGTERMRLDARGTGGARVVQSAEATSRSSDDGTGPVPIVGDRPGPPVRRPSGEIPVVSDAPPAEELPTTERPAVGRAGRNLGAAIAVGLSLAAVIVASLLVWRPAFVGVERPAQNGSRAFEQIEYTMAACSPTWSPSC